jgi:hypothetical protein
MAIDLVYLVDKLLPVGYISSTGDRIVPWSDESANVGLGSVLDERLDHTRAIIEVEVTFHGPFGLFDVDLAGWDPVLGDPGERVMDRPERFGGDDDDLVAPLAELPKGVDRVGIGVEVPEEGVPIVISGPLPESTHVLEVGQAGDGVPGCHRVNRQLGPVLLVVAANPTGIEIGNDPIEVYTQSHTREGKGLRFMNGGPEG